MSKELFFEQALKACTRKDNLGRDENTFDSIASLWQGYLDTLVQPIDVCMMMILLKTARVLNRYKIEDSLADIAGYAACANEMLTREKDESE